MLADRFPKNWVLAVTLLPGAVRGLGLGVLATVNGIGDFVPKATVGVLWVISPAWAMTLVSSVR
jgi:hypothetical protein